MEAAVPIRFETPKPILDKEKINFIEEIKIKKEKDENNIQLGIKEDDLVIKVTPENSNNIFYYQKSYTINEFQNLSKIFAVYETVKDIIAFLKELKYELEEKNDILILKFEVFMPNGKSKLIELSLKKCLPDNNHMINYLFEKIKSMETNIKNLEENSKKEKIKYELETKDLKENFSKFQINISNLYDEKFKNERAMNESEIKYLKQCVTKYQNESTQLKEDIMNYKNEISNLKEENKRLWEEINNLKKFHERPQIKFIDSKIIESINSIDFILDYIRQNDKLFNFNNIKLLYRGSRDGDRTKTCHQLCDNKQNVLIVMKSDTGYIFGGYSKIGFKINNNCEYKIDNNSFLFSINFKKIYPVVKDKLVICNIDESCGLCFKGSFAFYDYFMSKNPPFDNIKSTIKSNFNGIIDNFEMNGGKNRFKYKELEIYQILYE